MSAGANAEAAGLHVQAFVDNPWIHTNQILGIDLVIEDRVATPPSSFIVKSSLKGAIIYDGKNYEVDEKVYTSPNAGLSLKFKPAEAGTAILIFTLYNSYERKIGETQIQVQVKNVPFQVSLTTMHDDRAKLLHDGKIQININTTGDASGIKYSCEYWVYGTDKGKINTHPEGTTFPIDRTTNLTYNLDREAGEPSGIHEIAFTIMDNYGQSITTKTFFDIVAFPKLYGVHLYYRRNGRKSRFIRLRKADSSFRKRDYPISKLRVLLYNCENKNYTVDSTYNISDFNDNQEVDLLHYTGTYDHYKKDCGCVQRVARARVWLIDSRGNKSKPLDVIME